MDFSCSSSDEEAVSLPRRTLSKNTYLKCACCGRRKKDYPRERYFRFPKDPELSKKWVEACRIPFLMRKPPGSLHRTYRLCSRHFSDSAYRTIEKHFLHSTAVPTIFPERDENSSVDVQPDVHLRTSCLKEKLEHLANEYLKNLQAENAALSSETSATEAVSPPSHVDCSDGDNLPCQSAMSVSCSSLSEQNLSDLTSSAADALLLSVNPNTTEEQSSSDVMNPSSSSSDMISASMTQNELYESPLENMSMISSDVQVSMDEINPFSEAYPSVAIADPMVSVQNEKLLESSTTMTTAQTMVPDSTADYIFSAFSEDTTPISHADGTSVTSSVKDDSTMNLAAAQAIVSESSASYILSPISQDTQSLTQVDGTLAELVGGNDYSGNFTVAQATMPEQTTNYIFSSISEGTQPISFGDETFSASIMQVSNSVESDSSSPATFTQTMVPEATTNYMLSPVTQHMTSTISNVDCSSTATVVQGVNSVDTGTGNSLSLAQAFIPIAVESTTSFATSAKPAEVQSVAISSNDASCLLVSPGSSSLSSVQCLPVQFSQGLPSELLVRSIPAPQFRLPTSQYFLPSISTHYVTVPVAARQTFPITSLQGVSCSPILTRFGLSQSLPSASVVYNITPVTRPVLAVRSTGAQL